MTLEALRQGGKAALARALAQMEADPDSDAVLALLDEAFANPKGYALGLTGPPGVGKSTLTGAFLRALRKTGQSVGVIAVDPSSRNSGGALLGDRTRIEHDPDDQQVFMRSMAARTRLGGVSDLTFPAMVLMRALFDVVIIETVGVGQSETDIADHADLIVFCAQPGSGDALQFMKAGVMEIPDHVLVTKGDMGRIAERAAVDLRGALSLTLRGTPPGVSVVSAETGQGIDAALGDIATLAGQIIDTERRSKQAEIWLRAQLREAGGDAAIRAFDLRSCSKEGVFSSRSRWSRRILAHFSIP
ncbi:ArgK/MeaB family GTPase [Paracoccaceae bacterium GXU_MW_L88]